MSGVHNVRRGGLGYYLGAQIGDAGYVEAPGVWMGTLAADLGLVGRSVDGASLVHALDGVDPTSGDVLDPAHARVKNLAFEMVLGAPKSVSLLYALGEGPTAELIGRAHDAAVENVLGYFERNVTYVRRSANGEARYVKSDGLLAAGFVHRTSRAPDPHLHTHLLVANLVRAPDGRWTGLVSTELYQHARTAHALYGSHLRYELGHTAGLEFRERRKGVVDLVGVRDATIRAFSRRSVEIADGAEQLGGTGARVAQLVGDRTRGAKDLATAWPELVEGWWHTAERTGLTATAVRSFGQRTWSIAPLAGDRGPEEDRERLVTEFDRPFTRRELATVVADRAIPGVPVVRIEHQVEELLSAPTLQSRPPSRFAGAPGARRFPRPAPEPRWTTPAIGARLDRVADAIETVASIDPDLLARRGITETSGHRSVGGDRAALHAVHRAAEQMIDRGGRVLGLASTSAISGHFEAITGVTTSSDVPRFDRRAALLVVYGARSVPTSVLDDSLTAADRSGATVLFVDRTDPDRSMTAMLTEVRNVRVDRPSACREAIGRVSITRDIPELLEQIGEASAQWRAEGRTPVVVAVDGLDGLETIGIPVLGPRVAAEQARAHPNMAAVVLGDARVLAAGAARAFGSARFHLGVRPVDRDRVVALSLDDMDRDMRLATRARSRGRSLER